MDLVHEIRVRLDSIWQRFEAEPSHTQALVGATAGFTVAMVRMNILKKDESVFEHCIARFANVHQFFVEQ